MYATTHVMASTLGPRLGAELEQRLSDLSAALPAMIETHGDLRIMCAFGQQADLILAIVNDEGEEAIVLDRFDAMLRDHGLAVD
jgi:hypothetical protein